VAELARLGGALGCAGLALLFVSTRRDLRLAGLAAWTLGAALLAAYLAPAGLGLELAAAGAGGLVLAGFGAAGLLRWPWALAFATLACIPVRIPVTIGSEEANLLVPLYAVVTALALSLGWRLASGDKRSRELGPVAWPLAAFVLWTGLSLTWTVDLTKGSIFLAAFVLPFGLLAIGFARLPWRGRVWMNPPYTPQIHLWTRKMAEHCNGIALLFSRTHRRWFREDVWLRAEAVLFVEGRVTFLYPSWKTATLSGKHGCMLVAYGHDNAEKLFRAGIRGIWIDLTKARPSGATEILLGSLWGIS